MKLVDIPGWFPWEMQAIVGGVLVKGTVCPLIQRGPRKGQPNYRKADMTTLRRVFVPATKE